MATLSSLLTSCNLAVSFVVLTIFYTATLAIINYRKLSHIKGPPLASISRAWIFWQSVRGRVHIAEYEALEKYGPVVRMGPDLLVTCDTDILQHMSAPRSRWRRSEWYRPFTPDPKTDNVFSTRDEKLHTQLKAKEAGGYNGRDIDSLEPDMDARVLDLIQLIKSTYSGKSMDIAPIARYFTLDVLSTVAFGSPFGFMATNSDLWDYNKENAAFLAVFEKVNNHPIIRSLFFIPFVQALLAPKVTDKTGMGPMLAFARKAVAERYEGKVVKKDMLGHFVTKGLSQAQCEAEAALQIIAGSDSTTTILRCTMYLLAANPVAYGKLKAEIDSAVEKGDISSPVVKYAEAQSLPYLIACIWEGLRMYPPLFGLKGKIAPPGGETIKGIYFPQGTEVGECNAAVCRNKDVFGEDSHIFRPERWTEADEEKRMVYQRTVDTVFGCGRFLCLGRHIAMMELHKTFLELLRSFDWAIVDPMKGIDSFAYGIHVQSNMNMIAWPRH